MTSARRTPRYVGVIGSEPMMPPLMGPHPRSHSVSNAEPSPVGPHPVPSRRSGATILSLHTDAPARYTPDSERTPVPVIAPTARPAVARPIVPVHRRPWRVMLVSASPSVTPRSFEVARWQARTLVAALVVMTVLATAFVASVVVAVRSPELFGETAELSALRSEVVAMRDSLDLARISADDASSESGDSDSVAAPVAIEAAAAIPTPEATPVTTPALRSATSSRPKPLSSRLHSSAEVHVLALLPRSFANLPVIGALASGFSLARRHPLLHRVRPHLGIDLAAPRGTRVSAPAPGQVTFVGRKIGFGLVVELDHGDGIKTRYAHLRSSAVEVGEHVTKGEAIAAVGTSGITTGPHLHYEVLVHGHQVDPLRFRFAQPDGAPAVAGPVSAPVAPLTGAGVAAPSAMGPGDHDASAASQPGTPR